MDEVVLRLKQTQRELVHKWAKKALETAEKRQDTLERAAITELLNDMLLRVEQAVID